MQQTAHISTLKWIKGEFLLYVCVWGGSTTPHFLSSCSHRHAVFFLCLSPQLDIRNGTQEQGAHDHVRVCVCVDVSTQICWWLTKRSGKDPGPIFLSFFLHNTHHTPHGLVICPLRFGAGCVTVPRFSEPGESGPRWVLRTRQTQGLFQLIRIVLYLPGTLQKAN